MTGRVNLCLVLALIATAHGHTRAPTESCDLRVETHAGPVCGLLRSADDNFKYASFRGVPYAKAPTGERRFKKLEPSEPWQDLYYAYNERSICYQTDVLYNRLMQPRGMSEDCIYANIHVPVDALPKTPATDTEGLPILVFIHGGGFSYGSGDSDLHGPEYLVSNNVIVITFNYRLNVFGFLSLNSRQVPGNAGLHDMITLLQWVQRNAQSFGGDPDNVTLGGQSAGAISAHLLTLSEAAKGLFKRAILMSGVATSPLYSPSPMFAQYIQKELLAHLSINATDSDQIYKQLVQVPAEQLKEANEILLDKFGFTTFVPTVETPFSNETVIIDDYPEILIAKGRGKHIPLLIGYTDAECETFRRRLEEFKFVQKTMNNPEIIVFPKILFSILPNLIPGVIKKVNERYYNGTITIDGFVKACTDGFYEYPVLKLNEERGKTDALPMYVYRFSYENSSSIFKVAGLKYRGAAHIEDMTYVFKTNSMVEPRTSFRRKTDDDHMKNFMTKIVVNFMAYSKTLYLSDSIWPPATVSQYRYNDIHTPFEFRRNTPFKGTSSEQKELIEFYDTLTTFE